MPIYNLPQAMLWICNQKARKFSIEDIREHIRLFDGGRGKPDPSIFAICMLFSPPRMVIRGETRDDVLDDLSANYVNENASISFPEEAQTDLIDRLRKGQLVMRGRPTGKYEPVQLRNRVLTQFFQPSNERFPFPIEEIPSEAFDDIKFVDQGLPTAIPLDFPRKEFPSWNHLSLDAETVELLWPLNIIAENSDSVPGEKNAESRETALLPAESKSDKQGVPPSSLTNTKTGGRPKGTGYTTIDEPLLEKMRNLLDAKDAKSISEAAWKVIGRDGNGAAGVGAPESKVRRLVNGFTRENNGEKPQST